MNSSCISGAVGQGVADLVLASIPLAWYGDDFTGATDTLSVVARAGLRTVLFLRVPTPAQQHAVGALDAVGIAGTARSLTPEAMRQELLPVQQFFAQLRPRVVHYKLCSTWDSAAHVGNLHVAMHALLPAVQSKWVPMVGGQPSLGRYCAFSHLFAQAGAGGAVQRIDRHPTMAEHPVTPMRESDLRLHLATQGFMHMRHVHLPCYALGPQDVDAIQTQWLEQLPQDADAMPVLFDATEPAQLHMLGKVLWQRALSQRVLALGSSSVAQALIAYWQTLPSAQQPVAVAATGDAVVKPRQPGPAFVFAGSLSPVTAQQIEAAHSYRRIHVDAARLLHDHAYAQAVVVEASEALAQGHHTLVYTRPQSCDVADRLPQAQAADLARQSALLVAQVLQRKAQLQPAFAVRRIGIAGGDTSSHITRALDMWALSYASRLAEGVTLCTIHSNQPAFDGAEIMLKGGQVGDVDLLQRFAQE
ncbi:four-carbon acid sugar kinase family protein [Lampropedia puyangensis]|uniref:Four-carbon acid sugar kinase family protein n=1 Tax=Lampropedia puyangensis TaxID=1330072 RepID=A0A4V4GSG5_9BURK|nr:four-carbon acid sugar kinase family protein [Lampropedia puyangensis]THU04386.1 four-carbon acid sugar kinase family protein [Lampropedia puyangensis]